MGLFNVSKNRERMKLEMGVEEKKKKTTAINRFPSVGNNCTNFIWNYFCNSDT